MSPESFSYSIAADAIPADGRHFHLEADEGARRRLAQVLGVEVAMLTADIDANPLRGGSVALRGRLSAVVTQTDVVTLEPLRQEIEEDIEVTLKPAEPTARKRDRGAVVRDAPGDDEADLFYEGRIDLGALVGELLAVALDPYPRAPGVAFEPHLEDAPTEDESPFAVLRKLKREDG
jgi:uncharacterized metal-binding protein YceD (DUF177 family)